jgi:hypothetical protein
MTIYEKLINDLISEIKTIQVVMCRLKDCSYICYKCPYENKKVLLETLKGIEEDVIYCQAISDDQ